MATYKVIQDIEAEDKLLGPLTFRQFVYAGTCVLFLYLCFLAVTKGAAFMLVIFFPVAAASGFFAWPWSRDQPTEVWALAKIRFLLKPRKRIWNQSGVKELVTVTAPKKIQTVYSNGLSEDEVRNRLRALADTIDSRGWAIKNVNVNMFTPQSFATSESDRLVSASALPQTVEEIDIQQSDDILEESNPVARQFDTMIAASTKAHREEILNTLRETGKVKQATQEQQGNDYWFLNQPGAAAATVPKDAVTFNTQVVTPGVPNQAQLPNDMTDAQLDEQALIERLKQQDIQQSANPYNHWHTIQPLSQLGQNQPMQASAVPGQGQPTIPAAQPYQQNMQGYDPAQIQAAQYQQMQQQGAGQTPQWPQPPMPMGAQAFPGQNQPMQAPPNLTTGSIPQLAVPTSPRQPQPQVTPQTDPAILQLAGNDDLDVATLARQANKHKEELRDEVVISLH